MSTAKFNQWLNSDGTENYKCRAWVNFNGTGTVAIRAAGNVSSITDNGVGDYTVNFTTSMPDANYSTTLSAVTNNTSNTVPNVSTNPTSVMVRASSSTSVTVNVFNVGFANQTDSSTVSVAIFR